MAGKAAARRSNAKRARAKREKAVTFAAATEESISNDDNASPRVPLITEDDLLAFQLSHFGDDTQPETWFVDAETALSYDPDYDEEDDGLGYYEDGVKRTLTDEQIEMFKHSEREQILREERLRREENGSEAENAVQNTDNRTHDRASPPASDISSMDGDLMGLAQAAPPSPPPAAVQERAARSRSVEAYAFAKDPKRRQRKQEVPYDERNKRKWEAFIEDNDPIEGSMTHRRIVREMDKQQEANFDLDY